MCLISPLDAHRSGVSPSPRGHWALPWGDADLLSLCRVSRWAAQEGGGVASPPSWPWVTRWLPGSPPHLCHLPQHCPGASSGKGSPLQLLLRNSRSLLKPTPLSQIGFRYGAVRWCRGGRGGLCPAPCCADGKCVCPLITYLLVCTEWCFKRYNCLPWQQQEPFLPVLLGWFRHTQAGKGLAHRSSLSMSSSLNRAPWEPHPMKSSFPCGRGSGDQLGCVHGHRASLRAPWQTSQLTASVTSPPAHTLMAAPFGLSNSSLCSRLNFSARFFFAASLCKIN